MNSFRYKQGISLVELAISISIIALLIVGTLGGTNMVKAAKIRHTVTEFTSIKRAIDEFVSQYNYLPGDMVNAYDFWGDDCGNDSTEEYTFATDDYSCNGDGDGNIEFTGISSGTPSLPTTNGVPQEDLLAWEHLSFALLYPGTYTGNSPSTSARYVIGTNTPPSDAYDGGAYMIRTEADNAGNNIYNTRGTTIRLGSIADLSGTAQQYPVGGIINAKNAYSIDVKLDDGKASSGIVYTIRTPESSAPSSGCVQTTAASPANASWDEDFANYDLDDDSKTCTLVYWYEKR